jgi:hypothetical protein
MSAKDVMAGNWLVSDARLGRANTQYPLNGNAGKMPQAATVDHIGS